MAIEVNTEAIRYTAAQIRGENGRIHDAFSNVDRAISQLSQNWKSQNGENAVRSLRGIKFRYQEDRYQVIEQLADFLERTAAGNYDGAEASGRKAAAEFK
jgi:hypothetical protein